MTPLHWEYWVALKLVKARAAARVPRPRPGLDKPDRIFRRETGPYERLGITEITDHYEFFPRAPMSRRSSSAARFGGLIAMLLLDRGLGALYDQCTIRAEGRTYTPAPRQLGWRRWHSATRPMASKAQMLTEKQFHLRLHEHAQRSGVKTVFDHYAVPSPGRVLFQAALANLDQTWGSKINFNNDDRALIMALANGKDHTVPAASARAKRFKLQSKSKATTMLRECPDRPHLTAGVAGWEEIADYALDLGTHHLASAERAGIETA